MKKFKFADEPDLPVLSIGMIFEVSGDDLYLLAQVNAGQVTFIGLNDGNRYIDPIKVNNAYRITKSEWEKLVEAFGINGHEFKYKGLFSELVSKS